MALTDADVEKQIKNMISFIEQEAKEKVDEISSKAEEEFEIEKSRLVQDQRTKMKDFFSKEEKKLEQRKKIQHSNLMNQARLKILSCRQQHIREVLDEASKRLSEMTKDPRQYGDTMRGLILQGLFQLLEEKVIIRCRESDVGLIKGMIPDCVQTYKDKTHANVVIEINQAQFLHANSAGGVELSVPSGRMKVVNTMESRLGLISHQFVPDIREILFGKNTNRKFHD